MDMLDYLMARDNIMPRLNQRILGSNAAPVVALVGHQEAELELASFKTLDKRSQAATIAKHLNYLEGTAKSLGLSKRTKLLSLSLTFPLDHFFFLAFPPPPSLGFFAAGAAALAPFPPLSAAFGGILVPFPSFFWLFK